MIAVRASLARAWLADDADVLAKTVDGPETIQAANSPERMLAAQMAALHALAMKNASMTASCAAKAADPQGIAAMQERQIANVEATRSSKTPERASEALQPAMPTIDRLRNGG